MASTKTYLKGSAKALAFLAEVDAEVEAVRGLMRRAER